MFAELREKGERARRAARQLATLDTTTKNKALEAIAGTILEREMEILTANARDLETGRQAGLSDVLLERLLLNHQRLEGIANDVLVVAALPDPVGETFDARALPNGLRIGRRRVPVGVIGVIYESRPNVTVDISTLCLKSGNAAILRGGKEAAHSNRALANAVAQGAEAIGVPQGAVQLIESQNRALVKDMLTANPYIDMIIPRGGPGLHQFALENDPAFARDQLIDREFIILQCFHCVLPPPSASTAFRTCWNGIKEHQIHRADPKNQC